MKKYHFISGIRFTLQKYGKTSLKVIELQKKQNVQISVSSIMKIEQLESLGEFVLIDGQCYDVENYSDDYYCVTIYGGEKFLIGIAEKNFLKRFIE